MQRKKTTHSEVRARLDKKGGLLYRPFPKDLHISVGDEVVLRLEDEELVITKTKVPSRLRNR